jgi:hypothetical protein
MNISPIELYVTSNDTTNGYTALLQLNQTYVTTYLQSPRGSGFNSIDDTGTELRNTMALRLTNIPHGINISHLDSTIKIGKGASINDFNFKGIQVKTTMDITFNNYPSTRNDASGISKALYVLNATGDIGYGTITIGGITTNVITASPTQVVLNATSGLKITGDTTLLHTGTTLANGAAAASGTLLNAPAAGNPTKWIPIDDNGITRYIPAW